MPAPLPVKKKEDGLRESPFELALWVRGSLLGLAAGLVAVFAIALWLQPYDSLGRPERMAVHQQLGLPPCTFFTASGGVPCPSCGMTTSFALLMHGDPWNSLRANWVGTLLALFGVLLIPWALVSALKGRLLFVRSFEVVLTRIVLGFVLLMIGRWAIVLALAWRQ
ncbi:MAG: DUF2752 domain-containing protein [Gemmataceae bacterium]